METVGGRGLAADGRPPSSLAGLPKSPTRADGGPRTAAHLMLVATVSIWGTLHPISKLLLQADLTPTQVALCRMVFAALAMLLVAAATGRLARLRALPGRDLVRVAGMGLCGYFLCIWLSLTSLSYLPAAMNSLLVNISPLFVVLFTPLFFRQWPSGIAVLGLLAGFLGVGVVVQSRGGFSGEVLPVGVLIAFGSAACWALYTALVRWAGGGLDPVLVTLICTTVATGPLVGLSLAEGRLAALQGAPPLAWLGLLWVGVVGTGLSHLVWNDALRYLRAASVSAYGYLIPVSGVLFSYLLLGEQPTPMFLLGALLIVAGVAAAQR